VALLSSRWLQLKYRVSLKTKLTPFWRNCTDPDALPRVFAVTLPTVSHGVKE
jgi:hypothetical protein